jgi:hypothetical protein
MGARYWTCSLLSIDFFKFACLLESVFNAIYSEDEFFEWKARREVDVVDAVAPQTQIICEGSRAVGFSDCLIAVNTDHIEMSIGANQPKFISRDQDH